jgi:hypothetical protein
MISISLSMVRWDVELLDEIYKISDIFACKLTYSNWEILITCNQKEI